MVNFLQKRIIKYTGLSHFLIKTNIFNIHIRYDMNFHWNFYMPWSLARGYKRYNEFYKYGWKWKFIQFLLIRSKTHKNPQFYRILSPISMRKTDQSWSVAYDVIDKLPIKIRPGTISKFYTWNSDIYPYKQRNMWDICLFWDKETKLIWSNFIMIGQSYCLGFGYFIQGNFARIGIYSSPIITVQNRLQRWTGDTSTWMTANYTIIPQSAAIPVSRCSQQNAFLKKIILTYSSTSIQFVHFPAKIIQLTFVGSHVF